MQYLVYHSITERQLRNFEYKIWRIMCGLIYDNETGAWRKKLNWELQEEFRLTPFNSFLNYRHLQWLDNVIWRNKENTIRAEPEWTHTGKRYRRWLRKKWIDTMEQDLKEIEAQGWRTISHSREVWRMIMMVTNTLKNNKFQSKKILQNTIITMF